MQRNICTLQVPIGSEPEQKFHIIGINPIKLESINQYENEIEQKKRELPHPKFKETFNNFSCIHIKIQT